MHVCVLLLLYTLLLGIPMVACESQYREICIDACPHDGTFHSKVLSHFASCLTSSRAMNSNSMVDFAMQVCFVDFHEIARPSSKDT